MGATNRMSFYPFTVTNSPDNQHGNTVVGYHSIYILDRDPQGLAEIVPLFNYKIISM